LSPAFTVGKDISIEELKQSGFSAILLATGLHKSKPLDVKGTDLENVFNGIDYCRI